MGFIGNLFGGKGGKGYGSQNVGQYEDAAKAGAFNMVGAKKKADGSYDFSNVGTPYTGAAGVNRASEGYDFSGLNKAQQGYAQGPQKLNQTYTGASYNPSQFNFQTLPDQYFNQAYQAGAKNVQRTGQGQLQQIQSAIGTRRPGLLMKAGQQNQRDVGENLANLNSQLGMQRMQQGVQTGIDQQKSQAAENLGAAQFNAGEGYKGYESRANLEKNNADLSNQYLQGLASTGQAKLQGQQGVVQNAQQDQMARMNYLMNLYQQSMGGANQAAGVGAQKQGNTLGFLGGLAKAGASVLPKIF